MPILILIIEAVAEREVKLFFRIQNRRSKNGIGPPLSMSQENCLVVQLSDEDKAVYFALLPYRMNAARELDLAAMKKNNAIFDVLKGFGNFYIKTKKYGTASKISDKYKDEILSDIFSCDEFSGEKKFYINIKKGVVASVGLLVGTGPQARKIPLLSKGVIECFREKTKGFLDHFFHGDKLCAVGRSLNNEQIGVCLKNGVLVYIDNLNVAYVDEEWLAGEGLVLPDFLLDSLVRGYLLGRRESIFLKNEGFFIGGHVFGGLPVNFILKGLGFDADVFNKIISVQKKFDDGCLVGIKESLENRGILVDLFSHQLTAVAWLEQVGKNGLGCLLADEMGLGKTIEIISYIAYLKARRNIIVAPAALLGNWGAELNKIVPYLKVKFLRGVYNQDLEDDVVYVVSYNSVLLNPKFFDGKEIDLVVLDEGQYTKNVTTKIAKELRKINSRMRVVVTGTPIENSAQDLWAHLEFVLPSLPKSLRDKISRYVVDKENNNSVKAIISLFGNLILRRSKSDVGISLPDVVEETIWCKMGCNQSVLYNQTLAIFRKMIADGIACRVNSIMLEAILRLRQCCSLPSTLPATLNPENISDSIKINETLRLIGVAIGGGSKVVVFSQFKKTLLVIGEKLNAIGVKFLMLDGGVNNKQRVVDNFQSDSSIKVFLMSFRAGGVGLNITSANVVILVDPWWNRAAEDQAFARVHRIGQKNTVYIYRLLSLNTVEEKIQKIIDKKDYLLRDMNSSLADFLDGNLYDVFGVLD